ncbi:MAG TPA: hypothetical protein VIJ79_11820 [Acidobacteriaceae bacterium]
MADTATDDSTLSKVTTSFDQVIAAINQSSEKFLNQCRLDHQAYLELLPRLEALEAQYGIIPRSSLRK